ncbi:MAG: hypothetical protein ACLRSW_01310 [Christensenellaceae bacterium]
MVENRLVGMKSRGV